MAIMFGQSMYMLDHGGLIITASTRDPLILGRTRMGRIVWDALGEHFYETGVEHVVLYPVSSVGTYPLGVAWNGVTSISESPSGADANKQWADNINYLTLYGAEEFGGTIEAFTYPEEFEACDGSASPVTGVRIGQQPRLGFGLAYVTKIGNDTVGQELAYQIHLIYGCRAAPSERSYETINDSPNPITFSWELSTTPVAVPNHKPTSVLTIDSRDFTTENAKKKLEEFEDIIFGCDARDADAQAGIEAKTEKTARLPLPAEVFTLLTVS